MNKQKQNNDISSLCWHVCYVNWDKDEEGYLDEIVCNGE